MAVVFRFSQFFRQWQKTNQYAFFMQIYFPRCKHHLNKKITNTFMNTEQLSALHVM